MRKSTVTIAAVSALGALVLSACSSSGGDDNSGSSKITAACELSNPPQAKAKAPESSGSTLTATGKVGVILPDTTSSARYTQYDAPLLQKAFDDAGVTATIQNAQGDVGKYKTIAQQMIGQGIQVLIMDSIDPAQGAAVEQLATTAGVKVIDYDRVNLGGTAQYYVSFDNEDVGRLQAQTLVDCLTEDGVDNPNVIMMDGGTDVDNNAVLFAKGAHSVFDPLVKDGKLTIKAESVVKGWDVNNAAPAFTQALTKAKAVDGVLAANDDIANAVITVLQKNGADGKVVVTGQDAGIAGLQNIVEGKQSMTVFKDVKKYEADAAAKLAIALLANKTPSDAGLTLTDFPDPKDSSHKIQALLLPTEVITQGNVEDVVTAGAVKASDICKGIAKDCEKLGVK